MEALVRRPHPVAVEVRDDGLVLRFEEAPMVRRAWTDPPLDLAYDARTAPHGHRGTPGAEVQLYLPVEGRDPGTRALRPLEVDVSGQAFDEVKARMAEAGFRAVTRRWSRRRPGSLVEFLQKGEEPSELPPEIRRGLGRLRRDSMASDIASEDTS